MLVNNKFIKFKTNPKLFFFDLIKNYKNKFDFYVSIKNMKKYEKPIFTYGVHLWKREYFETILDKNRLFHLPFHIKEKTFLKKWSKIILSNKNSEFLIWGLSCPEYILEFINKNNIKARYVEDGFIRSIELGSNHTLPLSLNFDEKTPYFDSRKESDLEYILNNFDFNDFIIDKSREIQEKLKIFSISKYNHVKKVDLTKIYGVKTKKRVLVIGQVEDDASIRFGCNKIFTNNDLVRLAYKENPEAEIIYKPHPDVLNNKRKLLSNPDEVSHISKIIKKPLPIIQAFETIDHVYTITSLAGFEALLHGVKQVTTIGNPFYSGWGLTDDRQINNRRNRKLTLDELFAGAYLIYPKYYSPYTKKEITVDEAIELLVQMRNEK